MDIRKVCVYGIVEELLFVSWKDIQSNDFYRYFGTDFDLSDLDVFEHWSIGQLVCTKII